ncbi:MAG: MFS transporter [Hyphomonas sp.]|nr:MFS transporter [Hyphomonas sp.]
MALMPTAAGPEEALPPSVSAPGARKLDRSAWSWATYQAGRDPYIGLVNGFLFAPYFATLVVGDGVKGQAMIAQMGMISGLTVAFIAPVIGATVDTLGPRKPWLALITLMVIPLMMSLWFAAPGGAILSPWVVVAILGLISILLSCGEVLFSSMLPYAAAPRMRPMASGLALSLGNVTSIILLVFILMALMLPDKPLFGLSKEASEPDRMVPILVALTFAICAIPLFLFSKDAAKSGSKADASSVRVGVGALISLIRNWKQNRDAMIYLLARTLAQDAGGVLLILCGVYAAGVMGWGGTEMLVYGLLGCVAGLIGGVLAGWLDETFGPKIAFQIEIAGSVVGLIGIIGAAPAQILFMPVADPQPVWNAPMFSTLPELVFVFFGFSGFVFQIAAWSSSRTLLTRLAPASQMGAFFGLAALAGNSTSWLGPMLVGIFTAVFHSQQAGFVPVTLLFAAGFILLFFVKGGGKEPDLA